MQQGSRSRSPIVQLIVALAALTAQRQAWQRAAQTAESDRAVWAAQDLLSGRIRAQCVQDLITQGVVKTNAQTQASDHPTYTAHRDLCDKLAKAKEASALDREFAYEQLAEAKIAVRARLEIAKALGDGSITAEEIEGALALVEQATYGESAVIPRELLDEIQKALGKHGEHYLADALGLAADPAGVGRDLLPG
jgi:hypothetical protein